MRVDVSQFKIALADFPRAMKKGLVRAINRGLDAAGTQMARDIAKDVTIKQAIVKRELRKWKASPTALAARLEISGNRIPLINWAKGPEPSRGKPGGVRSRLRGGTPVLPHAFITRTRSGHRGVFQRIGPARLPVAQLHGPSLPHVFEKFAPAAAARGQAQIQKNLAHEIEWALEQSALKGK